MNRYLVLLRGVNVGGKNKVSMLALRSCLEEAGFANVSTYIASGNVILESTKTATAVQKQIEQLLPHSFKLHSELIKVLVLTQAQLQAVVDSKPKHFGENATQYYSDAIFLIGIDADEALKVFKPREGVDVIWPGKGVIYSQRLGAQRTKSRLSSIVGTPAYAAMTIRSWNTVTKLLALFKESAG